MDAQTLDYSPLQQYLDALHLDLKGCTEGEVASYIKVCERLSAEFGLHLYHSIRATTATVIRRTYDGSQVHSKRLRREGDLQFLEANGQPIRVFALQGDLMFGSTESVMKNVLDALPEANYFILDLKHVFEIDRAACQLLRTLKQTLWAQGKTLLFTHTADKYGFTRYLRQRLKGQNDRQLFAFADTDHALEWCEERLLAQRTSEPSHTKGVALTDQDLCRGLAAEDIAQLGAIAKPVT